MGYIIRAIMYTNNNTVMIKNNDKKNDWKQQLMFYMTFIFLFNGFSGDNGTRLPATGTNS